MKLKRVMLISLFAFMFLAGCEQKIAIRFPSQQKWSVNTIADFDSDLVQGAGEIAGDLVGSEFGLDIPGSFFDPKVMLPPVMRMYEQAFEQQGMDFDWSYVADKLKYEVSGTSFDQLTNGTSPSYMSIVPTGGGIYRLSINYLSLGEEYMAVTGFVYETELTVSAGKIISSNADKVIGTKATWYNPTNIEVTFKPGSSANAGPLLLVLGGLAAIFGIVKALANSGNKIACPACGAKVKKDLEECPNCGSWL